MVVESFHSTLKKTGDIPIVHRLRTNHIDIVIGNTAPAVSKKKAILATRTARLKNSPRALSVYIPMIVKRLTLDKTRMVSD